MKNRPRSLAGTRVLDLGVGMAAALATKLLVEAGASVTRLEPVEGDPFYAIYPAYHFWHRGKTIRTASPEALAEALKDADICVVGGEAHPDLHPGQDPQELLDVSGRLIVLEIAGAPTVDGKPVLPAVDLLAQARSGLAFQTDPSRPTLLAFPAGSYGAALYGVTAVLAALWARPSTGGGEIISTSLLQGALMWCASLWGEAEHATPTLGVIQTKGAFIALCTDGVYVHATPRTLDAYEIVFDALKVDPEVREQLAATSAPRPSQEDARVAARHASEWRSRDLLDLLWGRKITAEAILPPGQCWDDPQTVHNGLIAGDEDDWRYVGCPFDLEVTGYSSAGSQQARRSGSPGPLAGVRVVDMGSFAAGPHASVILGDLGAEVIKIEPLTGDPVRSLTRIYSSSSRGKRSIAIDAKSPDGAAVIQRICSSADIVHHNFRPGVSARLGVDAASLSRRNPAVIVLESSAYGPDGPKAQQSGYDGAFQAASGHKAAAGGKGNAPGSYPFLIADFGTGVLGAIALALALLLKQKGAVGVTAFANLLNSAIFLMSEVVRTPDGPFVGVPEIDGGKLARHPSEAYYQTADGWVAIAARGEAMARRLVEALGLGGQITAPAGSWDLKEAALLRAAVSAITTRESLQRFEAARVWAEPCQTDMGAAIAAPSMAALGLVLTGQDRELGRMRLIGRAFNFARAELPSAGRGEVDRIGGHSREILEDAGYSPQEIADLFASGAVA